MGRVIVNAAVSLDGYAADPSWAVHPLLGYHWNGEVEVTLGDPIGFPRHASNGRIPAPLRHASVACAVIGRRLFDLRPAGDDAPFTARCGVRRVTTSSVLPPAGAVPDEMLHRDVHAE
jgi:hypothetical protein